MSNSARLFAVLLISGGLAACERSKSANPLSPTIAGPLPNVSMTPPTPMQPEHGKEVLDTQQPVVFVLMNALSNSPRPFSTQVQIATDDQFSNVVTTLAGGQPGDDGYTRLSLPDRLAPGRRYYWRGIADDGANTSGWSGAVMFDVVIPVILGTPEPLTPIGNAHVSSVTPELRLRNASASGPHLELFYEFQISPSPNFTTFIADAEVPSHPSGETRYTSPPLPSPETPYYWRARLYDARRLGPWSRVEAFVSPPSAPAPAPTPQPGPGGSPGSCASSDGDYIADCIAAKYPDYVRPTSSVSERQANMAFLRDRMIEAGRCGGMDVGWNLKRGGPQLSFDYVAVRTGGRTLGVDIGHAYDDYRSPLRLTWAENDDDPFATYGGYTNSFSCN